MWVKRRLSVAGRASARAGKRADQLFDDFARGEVAFDAVEAAGAEDAAHAAADLRADARRTPAFVLDQHAFDLLAVAQLEQKLVRIVGVGRGTGKSVIASNVSAPRATTARRSWRARSGFSPCASSQASKSWSRTSRIPGNRVSVAAAGIIGKAAANVSLTRMSKIYPRCPMGTSSYSKSRLRTGKAPLA